MELAISIGQGAGLAIACGLVALLPLGVGAVAALASALPGALGAYDDTPVVAGCVGLGVLQAALATLVPPRLRLALAAVGGGGVFELAAGEDLPWAGIVIGAVLALASAWVAVRVVERARAGEGTDSGVSILAAGAGLLAAGLALVPFAGYLLVAAAGWLVVRARRGEQAKYAGLRVLR